MAATSVRRGGACARRQASCGSIFASWGCTRGQRQAVPGVGGPARWARKRRRAPCGSDLVGGGRSHPATDGGGALQDGACTGSPTRPRGREVAAGPLPGEFHDLRVQLRSTSTITTTFIIGGDN